MRCGDCALRQQCDEILYIKLFPMNKKLTPSKKEKAQPSAEKLSLGELFAEVSGNYPGLKIPDDAMLKKLDESSIQEERNSDTGIYIGAMITAVILVLSFPIFMSWGYEALKLQESILFSYLDQGAYLKRHPGVLIGLCAFSCSAVVYAFLLYRGSSFVVSIRFLSFLDEAMPRINSTGWKFRLYQLLMTYLAAGVAIFLLHSLYVEVRPYTQIAAYGWLLLLMVPLSICPSILLMVMYSILVLRRGESREAIYLAVVRKILLLLVIFKDISDPHLLSIKERMKAVGYIEKVAKLLRQLSLEVKTDSKVGRWTQARMDRIADNFLALGAWVYFPKADSVALLKDRLVNYLNILLSGVWDDLPAKNVDETFPFLLLSAKRSYLKRLGGLIWLLVLVTLPLLIYTGTVIMTSWSIPTSLQTPAAIAYSAWVGTCLLAHLDELAPEAKGTLMDVLKFVSRR